MVLVHHTILLTGGSSGIGLALAKTLARQGNTVWSLDRDPFPEKIGGVYGIVADITNASAVRSAVKAIEGPVHILINNAGCMRRGALLTSSEEDFDKIFSVHVKGSWLVWKEVAPFLAPGATIVNISSIHALRRDDDPGLYTLAKQTLSEMGKNIALARPDWNVKTVYPGPVDTPLARHGVTGEALAAKESIMVSPESLAEEIAGFLLMPERELVYDATTRKCLPRA